MKGFAVLLLAVWPSAGQPMEAVPVFSRDGIGAIGRSANVLAPGMVLALYGGHLAPEPVCGQPKVQPALELCGVRVLIGTSPAELLYVSSGQINFKIPADVPAEGFAPLRVCDGVVCSQPLRMWFSTHTALISLERPAYVHMPVWIHVDPPPPYVLSYPCWDGPRIPPGYDFEVQRDGRSLAPLRQPPPPANPAGSSAGMCEGAPSARGALPLHLLYRFDEPGTYAVRFTARKEGRILYQSEWTGIEIGPYSEEKRDAWLKSLDAEIKDGSRVVSDVIPSLLAWPDEKALAVLLKIIPAHTDQCTNFDCVKLSFGMAAMAWFDAGRLPGRNPGNRSR